MRASNLHPGAPVARTTLRPPHRVVEAIDCHAHHNGMTRSAAIREALDDFLAGVPARSERAPGRLYRQLNSRLVATPLPFSCPPRRLAQYRSQAQRLGYESLCGLVAVAIVTVHQVRP